jgi:hypothetical protein
MAALRVGKETLQSLRPDVHGSPDLHSLETAGGVPVSNRADLETVALGRLFDRKRWLHGASSVSSEMCLQASLCFMRRVPQGQREYVEVEGRTLRLGLSTKAIISTGGGRLDPLRAVLFVREMIEPVTDLFVAAALGALVGIWFAHTRMLFDRIRARRRR